MDALIPTPFSPVLVFLFCLTLLITALGFRQLVYFVSIGYAFAVTAMALATLFIFRQHLTLLSGLQSLMLTLWGMRLGIFLLRRKIQPSFQKHSQAVTAQYAGVSYPLKIVIWLGVSLLYVAMFLPALYSTALVQTPNPMPASPSQMIGLCLMIGGLVIEALADWQKSVYKTRCPQSFCNRGLYRWIRCPNYLGEIIFWLGNWVMGISFYITNVHWGMSLTGLVLLILVMVGSAKRLTYAQDQRYGHLPAYQTYIQNVPVLLPFIPIYTLKKQ